MLRVGLIAASMYNANPFREKGSRLMEAEDFIAGDAGEPSEEEKLEQWKHFFEEMAAQQEKKEVSPN